MFGGSTNAALLRYGTLNATVLSELHWGLRIGTEPSATPGAKLQRALLPAPKKFWLQFTAIGEPLTYV